MGSIISPQLPGPEPTQDLPTASSLCAACAQVCPVSIPIPELLMQLRHAAKHEAAVGSPEALAWKTWAWLNERPGLYGTAVRAVGRLRALAPARQGGWTAHRSPMRPAAKSPRERLAQEKRAQQAGA
jgi:L-lactate dehydrogenase complex protein LldF